MKKEIPTTILIALALCLALSGQAAAEAGLTAAPALNAPLGARSAAMGQAFTAVAGSAESLNYNPGALAFAEGVSVTASYMRGFDDGGHSFIAVPISLGKLVITPGFMNYNAGNIDLNLTSGRTGNVNAETDRTFYASAAFLAGKRLGLGVTAKHTRIELAETTSAQALNFDIGALYEAGGGLSFGAAYMNAGEGFRFEEKRDPAPAVKRLGAAYRLEINPPNLLDPSADLSRSEVLFTADWTGHYKDKGYYQAGAELVMDMSMGITVNFRGGYLFDRPAEGMTFGFGLGGKKWAFDFSLGTAKEMNARQQAGVSYRF